METQTYNTRTKEEVTAVTEQTGDADAATVVTIIAQRRDARDNGVTTHPKDLDVRERVPTALSAAQPTLFQRLQCHLT